MIDAFADAHGVRIAPMLELGSHDLLTQFAQIHLGLAFVIREFVGEEIAQGKLTEVPLTPALPERAVGVAHLVKVPLSPAAKAFAGLCIED